MNDTVDSDSISWSTPSGGIEVPGPGHGISECGHGQAPPSVFCPPPPVPEPAVWVFLVVGVMVALLWKWRKEIRSRCVKINYDDIA